MKKQDKIILIIIGSMIFIGVMIFSYYTSQTEIELSKPHPVLKKTDSINGMVLTEYFNHGTIYITMYNGIRFQTSHSDFVNSENLGTNDIILDRILTEEAVINKKANNDTIIINYKNKADTFVLKEPEPYK